MASGSATCRGTPRYQYCTCTAPVRHRHRRSLMRASVTSAGQWSGAAVLPHVAAAHPSYAPCARIRTRIGCLAVVFGCTRSCCTAGPTSSLATPPRTSRCADPVCGPCRCLVCVPRCDRYGVTASLSPSELVLLSSVLPRTRLSTTQTQAFGTLSRATDRAMLFLTTTCPQGSTRSASDRPDWQSWAAAVQAPLRPWSLIGVSHGAPFSP